MECLLRWESLFFAPPDEAPCQGALTSCGEGGIIARPFEYSRDRRIVNRIIIWMLKLGIAPRHYNLLTVTGRITGMPHSVPVVLVEEGTKRWLVAPYGEVDWVKNARKSGIVNLTRRKQSEDLGIREIPPEEAAPVLKKYLDENPITKPYFDAQEDSSLDEFVEEARSRPAFELIKIESRTDDAKKNLGE